MFSFGCGSVYVGYCVLMSPKRVLLEFLYKLKLFDFMMIIFGYEALWVIGEYGVAQLGVKSFVGVFKPSCVSLWRKCVVDFGVKN